MDKDPIMPVLKSMEIGDTHTYPCSRMNTVKAQYRKYK